MVLLLLLLLLPSKYLQLKQQRQQKKSVACAIVRRRLCRSENGNFPYVKNAKEWISSMKNCLPFTVNCSSRSSHETFTKAPTTLLVLLLCTSASLCVHLHFLVERASEREREKEKLQIGWENSRKNNQHVTAQHRQYSKKSIPWGFYSRAEMNARCRMYWCRIFRHQHFYMEMCTLCWMFESLRMLLPLGSCISPLFRLPNSMKCVGFFKWHNLWWSFSFFSFHWNALCPSHDRRQARGRGGDGGEDASFTTILLFIDWKDNHKRKASIMKSWCWKMALDFAIFQFADLDQLDSFALSVRSRKSRTGINGKLLL